MHIRSAALTRSPEIPLGNCIIMLLMTGAFAVQMLVDPGAKHLAGLVLRTWSVSALLGHMWLHMTTVHLVGNLITLWIFGHYVCPRMGAVTYVAAYATTGLGAGLVHVACDGRPVIGASGAIMGVLGMYVVVCFRQLGRLGPWLILVWFVATLSVGVIGGFPAAYMAHVGGFLTGMILAACLIFCHLARYDRTLP
jgi:membrane associated rhomboid family serine protease